MTSATITASVTSSTLYSGGEIVAEFELKYRDTRPVLAVALLDPDGSAHDLTGASGVKLHIWLERGPALTRAMVLPGDLTTGVVTYTWLASDWDTGNLALGTHRMEYEVIGAGTARLTMPNDGYDDLIVIADIGQGS